MMIVLVTEVGSLGHLSSFECKNGGEVDVISVIRMEIKHLDGPPVHFSVFGIILSFLE